MILTMAQAVGTAIRNATPERPNVVGIIPIMARAAGTVIQKAIPERPDADGTIRTTARVAGMATLKATLKRRGEVGMKGDHRATTTITTIVAA
jgi:hypothetical protein